MLILLNGSGALFAAVPIADGCSDGTAGRGPRGTSWFSINSASFLDRLLALARLFFSLRAARCCSVRFFFVLSNCLSSGTGCLVRTVADCVASM